MHRVGVVLVLAGCRLHFDDRPVDAPADAAPLQLACNTPVKLLDVPAAANPRMSATTTGSEIIAAWIDDGAQIVAGGAQLVASDSIFPVGPLAAPSSGYTQLALAGTQDALFGVFSSGATANDVRLLDPATFATVAGPTPTTIQITSPRAATATGSTSGDVFAFTGNDTTANRAMFAGADANASLSVSVDSGNVNTRSSIRLAGDRLALVDDPPVNNCEIKTADLAVTSRTATVGWGTNGQCTQDTVAYAPGRTDALLVRHDMTDGDLNHAIATRNGLTYSISVEHRLRNPGNEARPAGVADGYWVSYETAGTIEAAHVDFLAVVGTVVPLGPLGATTAHETVVVDGQAYAIWLADGLEIARLCE